MCNCICGLVDWPQVHADQQLLQHLHDNCRMQVILAGSNVTFKWTKFGLTACPQLCQAVCLVVLHKLLQRHYSCMVSTLSQHQLQSPNKLVLSDALVTATSGGIRHSGTVVSSWRLCKVTAICPTLQRSFLLTAGHGPQMHHMRGAACTSTPFTDICS